MTRATFKQADVTKIAKGLQNAGWPVGSFKVVIEGGVITALPIDAAADDGAALGRRIEDAYGSDRRAAPLRPS